MHPLLRRLLTSAANVLFKSVIKAYKQTVKEQGTKVQNPFSEYVKKTMQEMNVVHQTMTKEEAAKILNLESEQLTAQQIMDRYNKLFNINEPAKGGSFYIQSKIHFAKMELMKDFPGEEELWYKAQEEELKKQAQQAQEEATLKQENTTKAEEMKNEK